MTSSSHSLKAIAVVILLAGILFAGWYRYSSFLEQGQKPPIEAVLLNKIEKDGLPSFSVEDLSGNPISNSTFNGKIVIVNFWASWCDPCVAEFPSLMRLLKKYPNDIVLLAFSEDYERADIDSFLKAFGDTSDNLVVVWDKNFEVAKKFGTFKLPESYILDREGKLIRKVSGVDDWASAEAFSFFEELVQKSK